MPNKFVKHFLSDRQLSVPDLNNRGLSLWKTQFIYAKPEKRHTHTHTATSSAHTFECTLSQESSSKSTFSL